MADSNLDRDVRASDVTELGRSVVEFVTTIAGYAAIVSALLLYFGYVRTQAYFAYFGVPVEALGFTTTDYVLRSPDALFTPAIWTALSVAVFSALLIAVRRADRTSSVRQRKVAQCILVFGTVATLCYGVVDGLGLLILPAGPFALALSGGLMIIQYQVRRSEQATRPPIGVAVVGVLVVVIAAFWAASVNAQRVGYLSAGSVAENGQATSEAIVYSKEELPILGRRDGGVQTAGDQVWKYQYAGYRVLVFANERWILIRKKWTAISPTVILSNDDSAVRIQLIPRQGSAE